MIVEQMIKNCGNRFFTVLTPIVENSFDKNDYLKDQKKYKKLLKYYVTNYYFYADGTVLITARKHRKSKRKL